MRDPETDSDVVVALVVVELIRERLVMVEVALLTRIPPEKVESPETTSEERVPRLVREELRTVEPSPVPERIGVPPMAYQNPEPISSELVNSPPPLVVVAVPAPMPPVA